MSISASVERLSSALANHVRKATPKDPILVEFLAVIGTMPMWRDMRALDQWEQRVKRCDIDWEIREKAGDRLFLLAESIFELGCYNLYGAIRPDNTRDEFKRVLSLLRAEAVADLPSVDDFDFANW